MITTMTVFFTLVGIWAIAGMIRSSLMVRYLRKLACRCRDACRADLDAARQMSNPLEALAATEAVDVEGRFNAIPGSEFGQWMVMALSFWRTFESYVPQELLDDLARYDKQPDVLDADVVV